MSALRLFFFLLLFSFPLHTSGAVTAGDLPGINLWWASSLTGLAAAAIVIVLINWNRPTTELVPVEAATSVPDNINENQGLYRPQLKTAEFTRPLEEELIRLQADIEKARQSVKEDIDFTF